MSIPRVLSTMFTSYHFTSCYHSYVNLVMFQVDLLMRVTQAILGKLLKGVNSCKRPSTRGPKTLQDIHITSISCEGGSVAS